jgi:serine/threonine protein kinase
MGCVYKAVHLGLSKTVAIKVLWPELAANANAMARFQREAKAASSLNHPGLVNVHDFGLVRDFDAPYLVMQYVDGKNLADVLRRDKRFSLERALNIFIQICDALAYAHEKGVIHRDIKPSNIVLTRGKDGSEMVQIVDFGIAMLMNSLLDEQSTTHPGEIAGSPRYMSPEQCLSDTIDCRSDIYSVSCVLYEALTGVPLFDGSHSLHTMYKQVHEKPDFAPYDRLKLPTSMRRILVKGLQKKRDYRYQTINQLKIELMLVRDDILHTFSREFAHWAKRPWPIKFWDALHWLIIVLGCGVLSIYMRDAALIFVHLKH